MQSAHHHAHHPEPTHPAHRDPVCGMSVDPEGPHRLVHERTTFGFCSAGCLEKFRNDPGKYLAPPEDEPAAKAPARAAGARWVCPMHPEIVRDGPGSCPICGMALEPETASAEAEENPELADMQRRFVVAAALSVPLVVLAMRDMLPGGARLGELASARILGLAELVLATPVVVFAGWPFFVRGWQSLANRSLNMFTLIGLGVAVAYAY
ncbi:MAG: heavy metal-binding domain-containing protein, partial [Candidatus Binatia bacterium]